MTDEKSDRPGVIAPPPLIFAAGLVVGFLIQRVFPVPLWPGVSAGALPFGASLIGAAILLAAWAFRTMRRAGTHVDPYKPTTRLVSEGPFRFTRNPLYLSLTLIYLGSPSCSTPSGRSCSFRSSSSFSGAEWSIVRSDIGSGSSARSTSATKIRCDAGSDRPVPGSDSPGHRAATRREKS